MIVTNANVLDSATGARWNNLHELPTHFQIRAVAAIAFFVLSLAAATATTTDVIFSCEEDEGEYADTDLETDRLVTFMEQRCWAEILEVAQFLSSALHLLAGFIRCFIALRVALMEVSLTKE